jgi:hypothetical protein
MKTVAAGHRDVVQHCSQHVASYHRVEPVSGFVQDQEVGFLGEGQKHEELASLTLRESAHSLVTIEA